MTIEAFAGYSDVEWHDPGGAVHTLEHVTFARTSGGEHVAVVVSGCDDDALVAVESLTGALVVHTATPSGLPVMRTYRPGKACRVLRVTRPPRGVRGERWEVHLAWHGEESSRIDPGAAQTAVAKAGARLANAVAARDAAMQAVRASIVEAHAAGVPVVDLAALAGVSWPTVYAALAGHR